MAVVDSKSRRIVLVADPETAVRRQLARALANAEVELMTCESAPSALSLLRGARVDVAYVADELLASGGKALRTALEGVEVVVAREGGAAAADELPSFVCAQVPRDASGRAALFAISRALELRELRDRAARAELGFAVGRGDDELVSGTKTTRSLYARAKRIAPSTTPVLILGERGTGKELLARHIHRESQRGELVSLDLSELDPEEVARELGLAKKRGESDLSAWQRAEHATLLLLHVELLSVEGQRAVKDRLSAPTRPRLLTTADATLRDRVRAGTFDEELFLELGASLFELPALRQRRDEIPVLANHFLLRILTERGSPTRDLRIGVEAMRALRRAPWPNNVAELAGAITHAALVARTSTIVPGDLPEEDGARKKLRAGLGEEAYASARKHAIGAFERAYVEELLERTAQNLARAAREAGMDRANFRRLVKRTQKKD